MADYQLYCFAQSGNAYRAALMLNLIGADWEPIWFDFFNAGVQRTPEFRENVNEMGEAPVLVHGAKKLTPIRRHSHLSRRAQRQPSRRAARTSAWRRCAGIIFDNQKIGGMLGGPYRFLYAISKQKGHPAVLEFLKGRALSALAIFDKRLADRPYALGAEPTIADVSLTSYLYYPAEEFGFDIAADHKNIAAWLDRMKALPGWGPSVRSDAGIPAAGVAAALL